MATAHEEVQPSTAVPPTVRVDPHAVAPPSLRRHALIPATLVGCAAAYYGAEWSLAAVVGLACALLLLQAWALPWANTSRERLDRDLLTLIAGARREALVPRVARAWGFRLFGAPAEIAARQGRALGEAGRAVEAVVAYGVAIEAYGGAAPLGVVLGYANAAFDAGREEAARDAYRAVLEASPDLSEARRRLERLEAPPRPSSAKPRSPKRPKRSR